MVDHLRCSYCRQLKRSTDMALMAPNGQEAKWTCFVCLDQIEMFFMEQAAEGCEACAATLNMLQAGRVARDHFEQTGSAALVEVHPAGKAHRPGCPVV